MVPPDAVNTTSARTSLYVPVVCAELEIVAAVPPAVYPLPAEISVRSDFSPFAATGAELVSMTFSVSLPRLKTFSARFSTKGWNFE